MSESWHICDWVAAHMWVSHGTHMWASSRSRISNGPVLKYEWVMTYTRIRHGTRTHVIESRHIREWVMAHTFCKLKKSNKQQACIAVWASHGTHVSKSWQTYEWVMARIWMSHGTHVSESWHTCERVMAHMWVSHVTHMDESWHTYEWVMARIRVSHGTLVNESWHTYEWVMTHIWMSHGTHVVRHVTHTCNILTSPHKSIGNEM